MNVLTQQILDDTEFRKQFQDRVRMANGKKLPDICADRIIKLRDGIESLINSKKMKRNKGVTTTPNINHFIALANAIFSGKEINDQILLFSRTIFYGFSDPNLQRKPQTNNQISESELSLKP